MCISVTGYNMKSYFLCYNRDVSFCTGLEIIMWCECLNQTFTSQTVSKIRRNLGERSNDTDSGLNLRSVLTLAPQDSSRDEVGDPGQIHKANTGGWAGYANSVNLRQTGRRPERENRVRGSALIQASNKGWKRTRSGFSNIYFLPKQTGGRCQSEQTAEAKESPSAQVLLRLCFKL